MQITFISPDTDISRQLVECAENWRSDVNAQSYPSLENLSEDTDVCVISFPLCTFHKGWIVNGVDQLTLIPKHMPVLVIVDSGMENTYRLLDHLTLTGYHQVQLAGWGLWNDIEDKLDALSKTRNY